MVWLAALEPLTLPPARMPSGLNATDHALAKPEVQSLVATSNRHIPPLSAIASVPPEGLKARDEIRPWLPPLYSAGTSILTGLPNVGELDGWREPDWLGELDGCPDFPVFEEFGELIITKGMTAAAPTITPAAASTERRRCRARAVFVPGRWPTLSRGSVTGDTPSRPAPRPGTVSAGGTRAQICSPATGGAWSGTSTSASAGDSATSASPPPDTGSAISATAGSGSSTAASGSAAASLGSITGPGSSSTAASGSATGLSSGSTTVSGSATAVSGSVTGVSS